MPARFPNARTYTDRQGNLREMGTGRIIRRAAASRPAATRRGRTFTDGQGVVRIVGSGLARNPLEQQVDAAILAETAPIQTNIGLANSQYDAERAELERAMGATNAELERLGGNIGRIGQLDLGMHSQQGALANHQANLDYLQSVLGGKVQDISALLAAGATGAAGLAGDRAEGMTQAQLGTLAAVNETGSMAKAGTMRTREDIANRLLARNASVKAYNDQLGAIKAGRADVRRQISRENLDASIARAELKLAQEQAAHGMAMDEEQLALAGQEAAAGGSGSGGAGGDRVRFAGLNLDENQVVAVREGLAAWHAQGRGKSLNSFLARITQSSGLSRTMVARAAMNLLSPDEIKRYSGSRQKFIQSMRGAGVNANTANAWANKVYGVTTATAQRPASHSGSGTHMPGAQRPASASSGNVGVSHIASAIKASPHPVKVGTVFRLKGKDFNVIRMQRTVSGMTYTLRAHNGKNVVVTV